MFFHWFSKVFQFGHVAPKMRPCFEVLSFCTTLGIDLGILDRTALGVALGLHLRVDGVTMAILRDILGGFGAILDASWTLLEGLGGENNCFP